MTLDTQTADHIMRAIADRVSEEFPGLTLMFIAYEPGRRQEAFKTRWDSIDDHPAGHILMPYLETLAKADNPIHNFAGVAIDKPKVLTAPFKKNQALACYFIDISLFDSESEAEQYTYTQVYRSLCLLELPFMNLASLKRKHGELLKPKEDPENVIKDNLMSDCFAGFVMRQLGKTNAFNKMARFRAEKALKRLPHYNPEHYPFPLALDLAKLTYKEQQTKIENRKNYEDFILDTAITLTNEVYENFDQKNIESWKALCDSAQELAWSNMEPPKILGTVIYSCEDPFIRSDAYMVAELLNVEPLLITNFDFYNPFTDEEVNERRHIRQCLDYFDEMTVNPHTEKNPAIFRKKVMQMNNLFLEGDMLGWCTPAFEEIIPIFEEDPTNDSIPKAEKIFKEAIKKTPWALVQEAGVALIHERRTKKPNMDFEEAIFFLKRDRHWTPIVEGLSKSSEYEERGRERD